MSFHNQYTVPNPLCFEVLRKFIRDCPNECLVANARFTFLAKYAGEASQKIGLPVTVAVVSVTKDA